MTRTVNVTCPHCRSTIKVDPEAGVVVEHQPPAETGTRIDFETRLQQMASDKQRASDRMAEEMRREKSKDRILEERFRNLMDKAKDVDDGTPPLRDIDLD
jgi:hypothetical protein